MMHYDLDRFEGVLTEQTKDELSEQFVKTEFIIFVEWAEAIIADKEFIEFMSRQYMVININIDKKGKHVFKVKEDTALLKK